MKKVMKVMPFSAPLPLIIAAVFSVPASSGCSTTHTISGPEDCLTIQEWEALKNKDPAAKSPPRGCCPPRNMNWDSLPVDVVCCYRAPEKCSRPDTVRVSSGSAVISAMIDGIEHVLVSDRWYEPPGFSEEADELFKLIEGGSR